MPSPFAPSSLATLVARDITFERGGRTVLDRVSVSLGPGTCLGVVGPNGAGKSTLLQVLGGLLPPLADTVRSDPPTATVGYLAPRVLTTLRPLLEKIGARKKAAFAKSRQ